MRNPKFPKKLLSLLSPYACRLIDPMHYPVALPPIARTGKTFAVTVRFQMVASPILCNGATSGDGKYRIVATIGEGFDTAGSSMYGTLLPNTWNGTSIDNIQVMALGTGSTDSNANNLMFGTTASKSVFDAEMKIVHDTLKTHASNIRVNDAYIKATPIGPALTRKGVFYSASYGRGGSYSLGATPSLSVQKLYDAESFALGSGVDNSVYCTYSPPDEQAFKWKPADFIIPASIAASERTGSMCLSLEDCSEDDDLLLEFGITYECIPSNASFELSPAKLTWVNSDEMDDVWNLLQTNARCHVLSGNEIDTNIVRGYNTQNQMVSDFSDIDSKNVMKLVVKSTNNNDTPGPGPSNKGALLKSAILAAPAAGENTGFWATVQKGLYTAAKITKPIGDILSILAPIVGMFI